MDWLEKEYKKRTKIIMTWDIRPGDYVNLRTWFGDVWAEVKEYVGEWLIIYRWDGKGRETEMISIGNVRKFCQKEHVDKIDTCRIATSKGVIKTRYPMKAEAYGFQGDKCLLEE